MKGYQTLAVTGDATISWTNYTTGNTGQCARLKLTGTLVVAAALTFPGNHNLISVDNQAGQNVTIKCFAGTGVTLANGDKATLYCDGTDYYNAAPLVFPTGNLTLAGQVKGVTAGTAATDAVNKTQMETAIATASLPATAGTVLVSGSDTTAGYLGQKVAAAGANHSYAIQNGGANEVLRSTVQDLALIDGGLVAASFAAAVGTKYRVPVGGTVTLPAPTGSGRNIVLAIGGAGSSILSGIISSDGAILASLVVDGDQTLTLTDYDNTRGWV